VKGTVQGPSTSDDKTRVSVLWDLLTSTGRSGCNNVMVDMISSIGPATDDVRNFNPPTRITLSTFNSFSCPQLGGALDHAEQPSSR